LEKRIAVIIGGGPAGLTSAYEFLKNTDIQPIVIERSNYWGGISRTVDYKNNKIDIGGHRFFSKSDVVMKWWNDILPIFSDIDDLTLTYQNKKVNINFSENRTSENHDKVMLVRKRKSRIFYRRKFFDYPISLTPTTIQKLGYFETFKIGMSYIKAMIFPIKDVQTLEQFFINRFGVRLYKKFFKDYTEKVWGISCAEISAEWGAQRIKGLSVKKTIIHYFKTVFQKDKKQLQQKDVETSLIEYFLYPKFGPGQMWEEVANKVLEADGKLVMNAKVVHINVVENNVKSVIVEDQLTQVQTEIPADFFISTMPVNELIQSIAAPIPENVREVASNLGYRDFITVGLLLSEMNFEVEDNWIYIQEPDVKVGRLQIFNNWSPFLVNDEKTVWVGLEYFCNEDDELWNLTESDMKALAIAEMTKLGFIKPMNVIDSVVIKMPKTYPAYFGSYQRFEEIRAFTDTIENLFLIGRNGMHKYNNQDHSMLTAIQAVQNIKNGVTDKGNIWSINTEQEYHEEK